MRRNYESENADAALWMEEEWALSRRDLWRTGFHYLLCCIVAPLVVGLSLHQLFLG